MRHSLLASVVLIVSTASTASAQSTMYVESCNLGCSSGSGGRVTCSITTMSVNQDIALRFSRPVDPASLSSASFQVIDVATGAIPPGVLFVDAGDSQRVVFRPATSFGPSGELVFGYTAGHVYRIYIAGAAQGDVGPFITSTDASPLVNQNRMLCNVMATAPFTETGTPLCSFGSGGGPCPCGAGAGSHGCPNSVAPLGAYLYAVGHAELSHEDLRFVGTDMPNSSALYFQGTGTVNGGLGAPFGDGMRCAGGTIVRLGIVTNASGTSYMPTSGPGISVRGGITAPGTRTYQIWYRDPNPTFCTSATFNLSNGREIAWSL